MQPDRTTLPGFGSLVVACPWCGQPFRIVPSRFERNPLSTCSIACHVQRRKAATTIQNRRCCLVCGSDFYAKPYRVARGRARFCSYACMGVFSRGRERTALETRLWSKVQKSDECWEWTGATNPDGYGSIGVGPHKTALAHRVTWELATGETLTDVDFICHVCDNPGCVRNEPEGTYTVEQRVLPRRGHLFKGTALDNARDMVAKGRAPWGDQRY